MTMDLLKRDVDLTTASMSVVELNNMVVSYRKCVKYAKIAIAKKLAKKVKVYKKKKKSSEKQKQEDQKRAEALLKQIDILNKAKADKITKFCLGLKESFEEVAKQGVPDDIALARVAYQKVVRNKVSEWREKHSDWQLLSAFLNTHISRRHKNRTAAIIKTERILKKKELMNKDLPKNKKDVQCDKSEESEEISDEEESEEKSDNVSRGNDKPTALFSSQNNLKEADEKSGDDEDSIEHNSEDEDSEEVREMHQMEIDKAEDLKIAKDPKKLDSFFLDGPFLEDDNVSKMLAKTTSKDPQKRKPNSNYLQLNPKKTKQDHVKQSSNRKKQTSNQKWKFKSTFQASKNAENVSDKNIKSGKPKSFQKGLSNGDSVAVKEQQSIHPSWAARKKEKEKSFINFQCKRIVFDDE